MFKYFGVFLILLIETARCSVYDSLDDYKNHPCVRECSKNFFGRMECYYNFTIELYSVLSRNCFDCGKSNQNDCFKRHCISANGVKREVKVVNRMLPGPSIQVCEGDKIVVNTFNNLHSFEATSLHWHGIRQRGSNHMDGVGMITQCPITPHTQFEYRFKAEDAGTHLWHAHSSSQRADGIFGAIVIRKAEDMHSSKYDYDLPEHVVVITDWMERSIISKYTAFLHEFGDEKIHGFLINGRGVNVLDDEDDDNEDDDIPRSVFYVTKGKRYRFRVVSSGVQYCHAEISIDYHNLTIIATDGNPIEALEVKSFFMLPGERIDFVLNANKDVRNYWIRVKGHGDCEITQIYQTAVLSYNGADSKSLPKEKVDYETSGPISEGGIIFNPFNADITEENENELVTIDKANSLSDKSNAQFLAKIKTDAVDKKFYLALDMNLIKNTEIYDDETYALKDKEPKPWTSSQINNITFHMPYYPLVFNSFPDKLTCDPAMVEKCRKDDKLFCKCLHTLNVDLYDVVEVILVDGGSQGENHPIHLHGQYFAVLGIEKLGDSVHMDDIKQMDKNGTLKRNLKSPPLKDTVTVPSGGYTIFRFYADNPGIWLMHCHVEFHSEMGMALIFKVKSGNSDLFNRLKMPDNWPTCGNFENLELNVFSKTSNLLISKLLIFICFTFILISL